MGEGVSDLKVWIKNLANHLCHTVGACKITPPNVAQSSKHEKRALETWKKLTDQPGFYVKQGGRPRPLSIQVYGNSLHEVTTITMCDAL